MGIVWLSNEILQAAEDILVEEIDQAVSTLPISNSGTKDNTSLTVQIQHQITLTAEGSEGASQGDTKTHLVEEVSTGTITPSPHSANF